MKIAIFGATGRTGRVTLGLALEQGFEVTALLRVGLGVPHYIFGVPDGIFGVPGWIFGVPGLILGSLTAFLGCFRFRGDRAGPGFEVTTLVRDPSRLPPGPSPSRVLVGDARDPRAVGEALRGQEGALVLLGTGSDLVDRPLTGDYEVTVGAAGGPGSSRVISAPDLGHFLLRCLRTDEFDGKSVYVSRHYPKE
ncbi:flavin reductase (NADPH) isoform X3 [Ammospiza caudacuta]|uniref:flavin reductase (NADPH) isoform X3 n=1 Tax=Ammospiza caudacuta TaxID=2857398 RepID=UPI0027393EFC|nr:flavin reductase (NADPH) isoform X3 [Ammospiza caudacuta]